MDNNATDTFNHQSLIMQWQTVLSLQMNVRAFLLIRDADAGVMGLQMLLLLDRSNTMMQSTLGLGLYRITIALAGLHC